MENSPAPATPQPVPSVSDPVVTETTTKANKKLIYPVLALVVLIAAVALGYILNDVITNQDKSSSKNSASQINEGSTALDSSNSGTEDSLSQEEVTTNDTGNSATIDPNVGTAVAPTTPADTKFSGDLVNSSLPTVDHKISVSGTIPADLTNTTWKVEQTSGGDELSITSPDFTLKFSPFYEAIEQSYDSYTPVANAVIQNLGRYKSQPLNGTQVWKYVRDAQLSGTCGSPMMNGEYNAPCGFEFFVNSTAGYIVRAECQSNNPSLCDKIISTVEFKKISL